MYVFYITMIFIDAVGRGPSYWQGQIQKIFRKKNLFMKSIKPSLLSRHTTHHHPLPQKDLVKIVIPIGFWLWLMESGLVC